MFSVWSLAVAVHAILIWSLSHRILLDNFSDAVYFRHGVKNFSGSRTTCLQSIAQPMPHVSSVVPSVDICTSVKALIKHMGGTYDYILPFHAQTMIG